MYKFLHLAGLMRSFATDSAPSFLSLMKEKKAKENQAPAGAFLIHVGDGRKWMMSFRTPHSFSVFSAVCFSVSSR